MLATGALALTASLTALVAARSGAHALILSRLRAPRLQHERTPSDVGLRSREVCLPTANGKSLFGWFVAAPGNTPRPAVVVMHGWGANASLMLPCVRPFVEAGISVLLLDARCHGASDDEAFTSMPRFAEDMAAGVDWLQHQAAVDGQRLALLGHSAGAAAALLCASQRADIAAVVSLAAFAHPQEVMRRLLAEQRVPYAPLGWYVMRHVQRVIGHRFDAIAPLATLPRVRCPVLLVHGRDDLMAPFSDAERLHALAGGTSQLLPVEAGHDLSDALERHRAQLVGFLHQSFALEVRPDRQPSAPA
jgi:pimeloyl-ACP methyl ester carboxylesterase